MAVSTPSSPVLTTIPLSPLKSAFSIISLPPKYEDLPSNSTFVPRDAPTCLEYVVYMLGLVACSSISAIGVGSLFTVLGGLILWQLSTTYQYPSNAPLDVVPILVGGPILGLPTGVIAARAVLSMTRTVVVLVVVLSFTLASAFAFPVGVLVLQPYRTTPSVLSPVQALAASGTGCAACLAVVLLLYATYRLVFVGSKLTRRFC